MRAQTDRVGRAMLVDALVTLGAFVLGGLVVGLLWPQVVDPVLVTRNEFGILSDEVALANQFDNDGWYTLLGGGCGLLLGVVLTAWRRTDELVTFLVVVAGAFVAAWLSARVGTALGPDDAEEVLARAAVGTTVPDQVVLSSDAAYLVWPIAAVAGALLVLWSPWGRRLLDRGREGPGPSETD